MQQREFELTSRSEPAPGEAGVEQTGSGRAITHGPPRRTPATQGYLPFIDGLRAVSIVAVVGFHVGIPGFSGGYVGVDVFFVISGFLIINQIRQDLESGRFSILAFYSRRAIRILPPLLLVLLIVSIAGPFLVGSPLVQLEFLASAVTAPLMLTNVLFFLRQGYFDVGASQKPLLHTWTLSVEEQFYLVVPLLLLLVFRFGHRRFGVLAAGIAIALAILSLTGAIMRTSVTGPNAAFYLTHWRAWEFIAGGLIPLPMPGRAVRLPAAPLELIGVLGLAALAAAISVFEADMPYPSWLATIPVAGASMVIASGCWRPQAAVAWLLARPTMVAVGLLSYGWYLWHWPILSFLRILRGGDEDFLADLFWGAELSFVLAWLSFRFLETPVRRWGRARAATRPGHVLLTGVAVCLTTTLVAGSINVAGYFGLKSLVAARYGTEGKGVHNNGCQLTAAPDLPPACYEGDVGILLGDSHADALTGSFARAFDSSDFKLISLARGGCDPELMSPAERDILRRHSCANLLGPLERLMARPQPPRFVIVTGAWGYRDRVLSADNLSAMLRQFDLSKVRILLIGPMPIFPKRSLDCVVLGDRFGSGRERCTRPRAEVESRRGLAARGLQTTASRLPNVRYIDPIDVFCDASTCRPFIGNEVDFLDEGHVLPAGADRILDAFPSDFHWLMTGD